MKLSYKNIIHFLLISSFAFLVGCDNETPFPTTFEGETVFHVNGQLNNDALALEAGLNDFYMYTDLQLSNQNILQFSGAFQKNDLCTEICKEQLKIIINNNQEGIGFELDSALYIGNYKLEPSVQIGNSAYIIDFSSIVNGTNPDSYNWSFGDGNFSTAPNPTHTYIANTGYTVVLEVTATNGEKSTYQDNITDFTTISECAFSLDYVVFIDSNTTNSNYIFWVTDSLNFPIQNAYTWTIEVGGNPITFIQDTIAFSTTQNIIEFNVCVGKVTPDCTTQFCKEFNTQNPINFDVSFDYNVQNIVTPGDSTFFSMVIIEYTTPDGVFYSSELGSQTNSTFEILSIIDHDDNERSQTTKKIEATVDCKLYNQDGSSLDFTSNNLTFGVSTSN